MKIGVILPQVKKLPEAKREAWKRTSLEPSEGAWPYQYLGLRLPASRPMRQ